MRRQTQPSPCPLLTKASIQVNATRAGWRGPASKKVLGTPGRFSRRLQLDPGLVPPTSWSPSPCVGPKIYWRAESLKSPGPEGICLEVSQICAMNLRSAHASRAEPLTPRCALFPHKGTPVLINYAESRSESVRGSRSPGGRSADRGGVSNLVRWRHARLVGEGAGAVVGPGARSRSSSEVGQNC